PKEELMNVSPGYWEDLLAYDQVKTAKKLKIPILIMQGARDYQVTMKDYEGWKKALGKKATYQSYDALNHMFFEGEGILLPAEYARQSNVPEYVIDDLVSWITRN
ncbi:MAG: alpha/beta hydrolase, partial [Cyclobacteriaceae bacterium]